MLIALRGVSCVGNAEKLRQECETLDGLYLQCNIGSFITPRALAFFDPLTKDFSTTVPSLPSANWFRGVRLLVTPT